ncbi:tetratricopeptide repeat protein [Jiangella endophytica]|uniref:tetratricopeptide repeat protein n=1 Tax=Jiangella endophytica TaxID=1623398 RepID=UPI0013006E88|nr:tetratricopeptide repeat protein [Jiangella endophytica]
MSATLPRGAEPVLAAAFVTGDFDAADAALAASLSTAQAAGDQVAEAATLHWQAMALHYRVIDGGRAALAELAPSSIEAEEALFTRALDLRRAVGDRAGVAESLFGVGLVHQVLRDDWDAAMPYFREALAEAGAHGDLYTRSETYRHVGFFHLVVSGRPDEAVDHLRRSLELRVELADPRLLASASLSLGQALLVAGRRDDGLAALRDAVDQAAGAGLRPVWADGAAGWLRRAEAGETPSFTRS